MLFDFKSVVLYGLMALSHASPVPNQEKNALSARAKTGDFSCPDGTTILEDDVKSAFKECKAYDDGKVGKYPAYFGNKSGDNQVLTNVAAGTDLREFPIVVGGTYSGGVPGAYRVVTDYNNNFRGVIQHTGATVGGAYSACTKVSKRGDKEDKEDKDKGGKKGGDDSDSGSDSDSDSTSTDEKRAESPATTTTTASSSAVNELEVRGKKKKVGSATCDGVTLSKDDVGAAFKRMKEVDDYGVGNYPHGFGNKSGGSDVFTGVTKSLREFPIIQGGVFAGTGPGAYRVVSDYSNNFVGVMIEGAGASFTLCTVNSD